MKVGNLVKHSPERVTFMAEFSIKSDFNSGLIIESAQTIQAGQHFWIVFGTKKGWYRESELTLLED